MVFTAETNKSIEFEQLYYSSWRGTLKTTTFITRGVHSMKKNKITAFLLATVVSIGMIPSSIVAAADTTADAPEYAYFMSTSEDNAYVWLGEEIEGNGMIEFLDGQAMGVTDSMTGADITLTKAEVNDVFAGVCTI